MAWTPGWAALVRIATRGRNANTLQHAACHLKKNLDAASRTELADLIHDYRRGLVPLVVPEPLRSDSPNSLWDFAVFAGNRVHNHAYADVMHSVRTGETAFACAHGSELFDYFKTDADSFSVFNNAMTSNSRREAVAIAGAYDFSRFQTLADVGGGLGFLLSEVMKVTPTLSGILFDLPEVVAGAKASFDAAGVADRVTIEGGSSFDSIPVRADAYMMKYIIHDWDDARARKILENCLESMKPGGKLLVVDYVIPEGNDPHVGKLVDIEMLVMAGGHERTRAQFEDLFSSVGLRLMEIVPTATPLCIVEGEVGRAPPLRKFGGERSP